MKRLSSKRYNQAKERRLLAISGAEQHLQRLKILMEGESNPYIKEGYIKGMLEVERDVFETKLDYKNFIKEVQKC